MESPVDPTRSHLQRRNGKAASCEPCRKRKLACDHGLPICRRCKRGRNPGNCVYLGSRDVGRQVPKQQSTTPTVPVRTQEAEQGGRQPVSQSLFDHGAGYGGLTSFSAVFVENRMDLEPAPALTTTAESTAGISADQFQAARQLLAKLPDEQTCNALLDPTRSKGDGWLRLVADRLCKSLWATFRAPLQTRAGKTYDDLVERIFQNSSAPLEDQGSVEASDWLTSISGNAMRWEGIGVIFAQLAFRICGLPETDPLVASIDTDRSRMVSTMKDCVRACISMCRSSHRPSFLVVYLAYKQVILDSMINGDTSLTLWTQHGELVALCLAAGLHKVEDSPEQTSMLLEMKKRTFAKVFTYDKVLSAFHGRPPLLSWRYSSTPLPLDVECETLLAKRSDRLLKREQLDINGWNTDGRIYFATSMRARMLLAKSRDRILELGLSDENVTRDAISAAKQTQRAIDGQLPSAIRYRESDLADRTVPSTTLNSRLSIRLEQLQNLFLLERLAVKNGVADDLALLGFAREMLGLTLVYWKQLDRSIGNQNDFEWFILTYAAPASGVLCVELINQHRAIPPQSTPRIPRSETIQNLSVFVGFLEWVRPSAPNAAVCARLLQTIKHTLDRILEAPRPQPAPMPATDTELMAASPAFGAAFDLTDDLSWMDWILDDGQISSNW